MFPKDHCDLLNEAIAQVKRRITVVRIAVAKFESTPVTPIFARIAVAPAKSAESNDQVSQLFICRGEPDAGPIETGSSPSFPYLHDLADDSGRPTFRE